MITRFAVSVGFLAVVLVALESDTQGETALRAEPDPPNILMIMVDDLGFSDLGCYGGEIETPNLNQLAGNGIRFSQFYNTAKCHSSRVSLLTGQYCIAAGDTSLSHAVTVSEVLRNRDYFTAMTGKWHLKGQPTEFGFDRYFGHLSGACNYFRGDNTFRLNGMPWKVPEKDFYTTVANVDYAIDFLADARQSEKPWLLYVAFNAPHAPLQVLPEDYAKYQGKYDDGWDVIRRARTEKQKRLGLISAEYRVSPRPEHVPAWNQLSESRKAFEVKRMTALAGMIDRVDQEIGRLVENLTRHGELENTLICFVSDNGACPYDRRSSNIDQEPTNGTVSWSDSTGWAWTRNSPFRYYKQNQFEGGISTPAIMHWPQGINLEKDSIVRTPSHLIDLMPTFADVSGAEIPKKFPGRTLRPVTGNSLKPLFEGEEFQRDLPLHFLFASDRAIRDGDWKAVSFRGESWELYNIANDRTELSDQAKSNPQVLDRLVEQWTRMAKEIHQAKPSVYRPASKASLPHRHREWTDFSRDPMSGVNGSGTGKRKGSNSGSANRSSAKQIRSRKNTKMTISEGQIELSFSGDDGGIAFDRLPSTSSMGPYYLDFEVNSSAKGPGDVFFVTDSKTKLPNGNQVTFEVVHDQSWNHYRVQLDTPKRLFALRLDVGEHSGVARIRDLKLVDSSGRTIIDWPSSE